MDSNQKTAIVALLIAVVMILAAIGIFIYELRTEELPSLDFSSIGISFLNRIRQIVSRHTESLTKPTPQITRPQFSPTPALESSSTLPPVTPIPKPEYETIFFGHYEQGNGKEPIEWYVLEKRADRCLLISKYALDLLKYHGVEEPVTWETSGLRTWLNHEFLEFAFTSEERISIQMTEIDNSIGNRIFRISGGNNTQDRIFLLSLEEAEMYFPTQEERICEPTKAIKNAAIGGNSSWWLRSPGQRESYAEYINFNGAFLGGRVNQNYTAIRPALWIASGNNGA